MDFHHGDQAGHLIKSPSKLTVNIRGCIHEHFDHGMRFVSKITWRLLDLNEETIYTSLNPDSGSGIIHNLKDYKPTSRCTLHTKFTKKVTLSNFFILRVL